MTSDAPARPGGYSAGLVAYIISNWPHLSEAGYLPRKSWKLASRRQRDRQGGATYELPTAYKVDIEAGLARLDPETRRLIKLRMAGLSSRAMGQRLDTSYTTALRRLDAAIGNLTEAINNLGGSAPMPRAPEGKARPTNGRGNGLHDPDATLPADLPAGARETMTLYDALDSKLERLPGHWRELRVKRGMRGTYEVSVVF